MTRRHFAPIIPAAALATAPTLSAQAPRRPRVAAIVTEYRFYSHADVLCGRLISGYSVNGKHQKPRTDLVSLWVAQTPQNDMSREIASRTGLAIYPTIEKALTLGGDSLAVDAVLFVGEHGNYPDNELGQKLYPRYELFQEILDVFRKSKRSVPTFFDKHLSYSWEKAKKIYDDARALRVPLMAGTSTTLTFRRPELHYAPGVELDRACVVGYGPTDAYGFHLLEVLECMVERRKGGETGVRAVRMVEGQAVWSDVDRALFDAAAGKLPKKSPGRPEAEAKSPVRFEIEYIDGLRADVYLLDGYTDQWTYAGRRKDGQIDATHFSLGYQSRSLPHFDGLAFQIENLFLGAKPVNPLERTLLTTGTLALLFESKRRKGQRVETPMLNIRYATPDGWHQTE